MKTFWRYFFDGCQIVTYIFLARGQTRLTGLSAQAAYRVFLENAGHKYALSKFTPAKSTLAMSISRYFPRTRLRSCRVSSPTSYFSDHRSVAFLDCVQLYSGRIRASNLGAFREHPASSTTGQCAGAEKKVGRSSIAL